MPEKGYDICEARESLENDEIKRLTSGIREISRFLDENRPGDASFVCAALLCSADGQSQKSES